MDITTLVAELTQLLGPALPFLLKAGERAGDAALEVAMEKAGEGAWERAKGTLGKLGRKAKKKEAAREALEDLEESPEDPIAQGTAERQLQKVLKADPDLAEELAKLLEVVKPRVTVKARGESVVATHGSTASRYVAVGGNVAGDVHVTVGGGEGGSGTASLRTAYLEGLVEQTGYLTLSGIDPAVKASDREARLSLDAVYTALRTLSPRKGTLDRQPRLASALEELNRSRRLVLLGDPGGGKSTFVNFLALCMAGELLDLPEANLEVLTSPLPADDEEDEKTPQPWKHGTLLPVRVVLRDFAAQGLPGPGEQATGQHLWEFIAQELKEVGLGEYFPILQQELREQGGLVLLDGLDEVPEAGKRRDQIRQAVESFSRGLGSKCRLLLTSRTYAYRNQDWRLRGFDEAEIAPFSNGQIRSFVSRWYTHVAALGRVKAEEADGRAARLERAVFSSTRLRELAGRPLLLTLMASLHAWRGGSLPERREELYADAVELLLNTWERHRLRVDARGDYELLQPSLAEWLKVDQLKVRQILEELAFQVHSSQPDAEGTADLPEERLVGRLMSVSRNPEANPKQLVDYLSERSGLLVSRAEGVYTFPHRTFQEYLAACHLTGETFPREVADLGRSGLSRWREVVLLAAAKAARGSTASLWPLVEALCRKEPESSEDLADAWGAHLAGQVVVESANLAEVADWNKPKLERVRRWLVRLLGDNRFPAVERALAGDNLARLGDPRPEIMTVDGMQFREVPAGKFLMGGEDDPVREVEIPYTYRMARFPVTVAQFREFLQAEGIERPTNWGGLDNWPITGVSWHEATAFCEWLNRRWGKEGWVVRLPSEEEWEKAARGKDGRVYPWEGDFNPEHTNSIESGIHHPSAVGCFPAGESPYQCEEMSGNVWEWTRSQPDNSEEIRVLRGGSYFLNSRFVRCAVRFRNDPDYRNANIGFRVALLPFSSGL